MSARVIYTSRADLAYFVFRPSSFGNPKKRRGRFTSSALALPTPAVLVVMLGSSAIARARAVVWSCIEASRSAFVLPLSIKKSASLPQQLSRVLGYAHRTGPARICLHSSTLERVLSAWKRGSTVF